MNKRISLDEAYMQMAEVWAQRSKAVRSKVGAIIVKDERIISDGYNGRPRGCEDDCCEITQPDGSLITQPDVLHGESNAILKLAKYSGEGNGSTLYVTLSPCPECAKLIIQVGIKRVVYRNEYRIRDALDFLTSYGVEVVHLPKED